MKAVVDCGVPLGLAVPRVEPLAQRLAAGLHRKVDHRRGPTEGRRARSGKEGVLGGRAAERQLHVRVHINATWNEPLAAGVNDAINRHVAEPSRRTNAHNQLAVN